MKGDVRKGGADINGPVVAGQSCNLLHSSIFTLFETTTRFLFNNSWNRFVVYISEDFQGLKREGNGKII